MSEFGLIRRHFTRSAPGALLGVGDDAALLQVTQGNVLAVSTDMLVSGTHFFPDADPFLLGHKTLAVNLSDMAAMGARPRWATLAISLPEQNDEWLDRFSAGFFALAQQHEVDLVGGDTTRGALTLSVTILGEVAYGQALCRDAARAGDDIWVSGELGDAALALAHLQGRVTLSAEDYAVCAGRLHQPQPRVALGLALRGIARSAIDISDGLLADLGHVLEASGVGAILDIDALPVSALLRRQRQTRFALNGGDDYELCVTAAPGRRDDIARIATRLDLPLTRIGQVETAPAGRLRDSHGADITLEESGYDHFG